MSYLYKHYSGKDKLVAFFRSFFCYALLIFWATTTILPLLWVFINSFKPSDAIILNSFALPEFFDISNYVTMMTYPGFNFFIALRNSGVISVSVVTGVAIFSTFAAFALGRINTVFNKYVTTLLVICLMVPTFATLIPNFVLISNTPMRGTYLAVILPQIATNMSFATLLSTGYLRSLPKELDEAAIIDGANIWQIFWKIIWPLSIPMIATLSIMVFIWSYNDLLTPLVYLPTRSLQPVSVVLAMVSTMFGTDYGALMAAIIITIIPLFILYLIASEQVVKGLTVGAVKG